MNNQLRLRLALTLALLGLAGCKPEIGDSCSLSTDCSANGDRLCDITQPDGYCTIYGCSAGSCPKEAICVAFYSSVSTAPACYDPQDAARLRRTYCMRKCKGEDDCRGGYDCVNMGAADNPWGSVVVERGSVSGRVCAVPYSGLPVPASVETGVCTGTDAEFEQRVIWQATGGRAAGGAAGAPAAGAGGGAAAGGGGRAGGAVAGGGGSAGGGAAGAPAAGAAGEGGVAAAADAGGGS
jgi:hypothetical protein